ncbi:hypothetical protein GCM10009798_33570 [Nocardioides panacihumi]|uniref:Transposase n=1 Tax=Nocardioides panacihumi TaxID=400774 RepID=A0ABN2RJF1_9ACTN
MPAMPSKRVRSPLLQPHAYADPPTAFGTEQPIRWHIPPGGDGYSRNLARLQHRLVKVVESIPDPAASTAKRPRKDPTDRETLSRMCARWGFSRSYWQWVKRGRSWVHQAALAGATEILLGQLKRASHGAAD